MYEGDLTTALTPNPSYIMYEGDLTTALTPSSGKASFALLLAKQALEPFWQSKLWAHEGKMSIV
jgi:hypothetical protein